MASTELQLMDNSPERQYDALLAEKVGSELSEERLFYVFRILDRLIPDLGVYTPVMKKVQKELFEACYSDQFTGNKHGGDSTFIERIPYFILIKRLNDGRDEIKDELKEQLEIVKEKLFEKQVNYETSVEKVNQLNDEISQLKDEMKEFRSNIADKESIIKELQNSMIEEQEEKKTIKHQLNCDLSDLQDQLKDHKEELIYLHQYKNGYDKLQGAFYKKDIIDDLVSTKKRKPMVATRQAHLSSNIEEAIKLEEQILSVQNALLEEYDTFLEDHKAELSSHVLEMSINSGSLNYADDLESVDIRLEREENRFRKAMEETRVELELLAQHRSLLQEQFHQVDLQKSQQMNTKRKGVNGMSRTESTQDTFGSGDQDSGEGQTNDPFIPQERVFCKYAAMLYTSDNNGKNYHEFKDARYCPSCGEKTVLCPHKILSQEQTFPLPPGSTHLKISRPKVRINPDLMNQAAGVPSDAAPDTVSLTPESKISGLVKGIFSRVSTTQSPIVASEAGDGESSIHSAENSGPPRASSSQLHLIYPLHKIWEDYKRRTITERVIPRPLTKDRVTSLIEQFASHLLWNDENDDEFDDYQSMLDSVYSFFMSRYVREDATLLSSYDFLASVIDFSASDRFLQLFAHILAGNYDGAVFRYILLIGDFIAQVEWSHVDDFKTFASVIYPSLSDDDIETLHMGFQSFSENKISKSKVADYIVYIILKYREPRFLEMEMKLQNQTGQDTTQMSEAEFTDVVESVLSIPSDVLVRRLFRESLECLLANEPEKKDIASLPIVRLAQITSYLRLLEIETVIQNTVAQRVTKARDRAQSIPQDREKSTHISKDEDKAILTLSAAKNLAYNISRRNKIRKSRYEDYYDNEEEDED